MFCRYPLLLPPATASTGLAADAAADAATAAAAAYLFKRRYKRYPGCYPLLLLLPPLPPAAAAAAATATTATASTDVSGWYHLPSSLARLLGARPLRYIARRRASRATPPSPPRPLRARSAGADRPQKARCSDSLQYQYGDPTLSVPLLALCQIVLNTLHLCRPPAETPAAAAAAAATPLSRIGRWAEVAWFSWVGWLG